MEQLENFLIKVIFLNVEERWNVLLGLVNYFQSICDIMAGSSPTPKSLAASTPDEMTTVGRR